MQVAKVNIIQYSHVGDINGAVYKLVAQSTANGAGSMQTTANAWISDHSIFACNIPAMNIVKAK